MEGAESDADVEVREDELDAGVGPLAIPNRFFLWTLAVEDRAYVGRSKVAHGMVRILSIGALVSGFQPSASVQGTLTPSILTLPDSVRRRPTLSQSCRNTIAGCLVGARAKMCLSVPS